MAFLKLSIDGNFNEVRQRLSSLPLCVDWLDPSFKLTHVSNGPDDSDSSADSECDDIMDTSSDSEAPNLVNTEQSTQRNRPQTDEDGWTTIPSRRRQ